MMAQTMLLLGGLWLLVVLLVAYKFKSRPEPFIDVLAFIVGILLILIGFTLP